MKKSNPVSLVAFLLFGVQVAAATFYDEMPKGCSYIQACVDLQLRGNCCPTDAGVFLGE